MQAFVPAITAWSTALTSSDLMVPIAGFGYLYQRSWAAVDFFLLFALFAGTARATVGQRLEGREGQLVSLALGAVLAVAGLGLELSLGINLTSLGPVAGIIFLVILGAALFILLAKLGTGKVNAAAGSVVALGIGAAAIGSGASGALVWVFAAAELGAVVAAGVLISKAVGHFTTMTGNKTARLATKIEDQAAEAKENPQAEPEKLSSKLKKERKTIVHRLRPITKKERKDATHILKELRLIRQVASHETLQPKDRHVIAAAMARVPPDRHKLKTHVYRVRRLDRALLRFDFKVHKELEQRVRVMTAKKRDQLRLMIIRERRKIGIEKRIDQVEQFIRNYDANASRALERAGQLLVQGQQKESLKWIDAAISYEEKAEQTVERILAVERMLNRLTKIEIRQAKKAA